MKEDMEEDVRKGMKDFRIGDLAHCAIYVQSLEAARSFYCGILGFKEIYGYKADTFFLKLGSMVLEIICDGKDHREENRNEKRHLAMACHGIEALHQHLVNNGVQIEPPGIVHLTDFGKKGCKYILFRGPEQERLEFQEIL